MLLTPHALVGAAIGASTDNLPLIIVLAFVSHFVLDCLPHFDWGTWHEHDKDQNGEFKLELKDYLLVAFDGIVMLSISYWLWIFSGKNDLILLGIFFSILTDLIDNVPFWNKQIRKMKILNNLHKIHHKVQYQLKSKYWYWGVTTQLVIILLSYWLIIR